MKLATFSENTDFNNFESLMMANRLQLQSNLRMAQRWSLVKQIVMRLKHNLSN